MDTRCWIRRMGVVAALSGLLVGSLGAGEAAAKPKKAKIKTQVKRKHVRQRVTPLGNAYAYGRKSRSQGPRRVSRADFDRDGIPDYRDRDDDNDGILDYRDSHDRSSRVRRRSALTWRYDLDRDGITDRRDRDVDGDGYRNSRDRYPRDRRRH